MSNKKPKKIPPKLSAEILCDEHHAPYSMIVTSNENTMEIQIKNTSLKNAIKAARDVYGIDEIIVSRAPEMRVK